MATLGKLEYLISVNNSQLSSGLSKADNQVKSFGNKMSSWAVAKGQVLGRFIEAAGRATFGFVKDSVKESMSFDKSMAQVAATLGKTTSEVKDLSRFARQMGATTAFTAQEAAEGLNYMALAGYDTQKSMKMLPSVLNLAAAGNMELARASDMVTDAESALALKGDEVNVMIDQMAKAASKTNTSVEQLGDAILTVGGTAKMMKGGTKELTTVLGVLADNGIKGSEGGTALRNVLLSLSAPTDKAAKQIKKLGVDVFDAQGNMRSMPDIMASLNDAMADMTQEERTNILSDIFNKRDLKSVEALLGTSKARWNELGVAIGNAKGSAKEMAETQLDNLSGDVTKLKSALGEAKLSIVEGLTPSLRSVAKWAMYSVQRITNAFKRGGLKEAAKKVKEIFGETMNTLRQSGDKFLSTIGKIGYLLKDGFNLKNMKANAATILGLDSDATWSEIGAKIKEKIKTSLGKAKILVADLLEIDNPEKAGWDDIAGKIIDNLKAKITAGSDLIKGLILGDEANAESSWSDVAKKLTGYVKKAFEKGGLFDIILGEAGDIAAAAVGFASDFVTGVADWIATPGNADSIIDNLSEAITKAAPKLGDAIGKILGSKDLWNSIGKGLTNTSYGLVEAIFGKDAAVAVRRFFGVALPNELSKGNTDTLKRGWNNVYKNLIDADGGINNPANIETAKGAWEEYIKKVIDNSYFDQDVEEKFKGMFSFDNMLKYMTMGDKGLGDHINEMMDTLAAAINDGDEVKIKAALDPDESKLKTLGPYYASVILNPVENGGSGAGAGSNSNGGGVGNGGGIGGGGGGMVDAMSEFYRPAMNAKGNWNVPYDNYPALLHRGEMVLTKSQARQFRDGGGGGFDVNSAINNAVASAMSKVYVMMNGDKVGDLTTKRIKKNINASSYNKLRAMGG